MSLLSTTDLLQEALALHRRGATAEAAARYVAVLRTDPANANAHYYLGMMSCQDGHFADGAASARKALAGDPQHARAHVLLGRALSALGQKEEALANFDRAVALAPDLAPAHSHLADLLSDLGRTAEAIDSYDRALALAPDAVEDWFNRGLALQNVGRFEEAISSFDHAIAGRPGFAQAYLERANVLWEFHRHDDALEGVDKALALDSSLAEAWHSRGIILSEFRRYDEALAAYDKALALKDDLAEAWLGRGNILREFKRYGEALSAYERALELKPDLAEAWLGRGNVFTELKRHDEALAAYDRALAFEANLAKAWLGRGNVFTELERHDEALAVYDRALALESDLAEAWLGRGNVFRELRRYEEAFAAYDRALTLKSDLAGAWLGRGNVFTELRRHEQAFAAYDRALALKPDFAEAWLSRGNVFFDLKQYKNAYAACDKALMLNPDIKFAASLRLYTKLHLCNWTNLATDTAQFLSLIRAQETLAEPFTLLALPSSPTDQLQCARRHIEARPVFPPIWRGERYSHDRIRVAYLSSELREHAVAYLTAGLFEHHDRSRFEVTAISFEAGQDSDFCRRIRLGFERFIDARLQSDQDIAALIRRLEIDIIVDLNGFTRNGRLGVFSRRPAPIQVNYLGYAGTMGADYYDYIVADPTVIPREHFEFYSENVAWLPDSFMANDAAREIAERMPTRSELGLPDKGFVFCCFNQSYKISPGIFDIWMRLLRSVDGSVLWLKENDAIAVHNLRLEAGRRGVAPERLVFALPVSLVTEHLARQRHADLFLDTVHYNAHTTASDALWAGLPVVTYLDSTFAGRVAASLLKAVGLPELITTSLEDYEALSLKLARDPSLLASIKTKLARNRDSCPLFDTGRFTRHIEAAYTAMWRAYQNGRQPANFAVDGGSEDTTCIR
jgi:predicted O-linked N-acetylglucosamine transferase (SPINDLY family)